MFRLLFLFALLPAANSAPAAPDDAAPAAIPERLDVVTFNVRTDGEDHKLVVTPAPDILRVDAPSDGYSIIYHPATQYYVGLENRNYTYWEFSWPQVRYAVESSQRYENRLREVGSDGFSGAPPSNDPFGVSVPTPQSTDAALSTNAPASTNTDDSGYVWHTVPGTKRIAGMNCTHWVGDSVSNEPADAWCYAGSIPAVKTALADLRVINDPIALVPVRDLVPPVVFQIDDGLSKGGNTPLLISWGDEQDKNRFELLGVKSREGKATLFTIPKLYVKTTLVTMDGIGTQKPQRGAQPQTPAAPLHLP